MADYIVSARKYRPSTFNTVVGQKALVQTLKNAIASGKLAHAYLFCGPRGVGKTTCARIFAKTINCECRTADGEACNECESCQSFNEQRSYNVYEFDAASNNSVDNIRELIDQVRIPPQIGRYKVFIIDEVHMLSTAAFNAFLKTLEEPPKHAIFVMCTTEKQKILPTILSRCQTYDFQRISIQDIVDQLAYIAQEEHIEAEPQALQVIARKADGGMRDALSVFDQITSFSGGKVTYQATIENLNILDYELFFRITDAALQGAIPTALLLLDEVIRKGFDPQYFIGGWAGHLRDLMVAKDAATLPLIEAAKEVVARYAEQAAKCSPQFLYQAVMIANECDFNYRNSRNKRLSVELAIVRICQLLYPLTMPTQPQRAPLQPTPQQAPTVQPTPQRPAPQPAARVQQYQRPAPQPSQPVQTGQPAAPTPYRQPQPAPQPASPRPVAMRGAALPGRTMMTSLHGNVQQPTQSSPVASAQPAEQQTEVNEPVDDPALRTTWGEYSKTIQEEHLLVTAMSNAEVHLEDGTCVRATVTSDEQMQRIKARKTDIETFLRQQLHNSRLTLDFSVKEDSNFHRVYTPRERMQMMRDANPEGIDALVSAFGLELK